MKRVHLASGPLNWLGLRRLACGRKHGLQYRATREDIGQVTCKLCLRAAQVAQSKLHTLSKK